MMIKKSIIFALVIAICFSYFLLRNDSYVVEDIDSPHEIVLNSKFKTNSVESLSIEGYGHIEGSAKITLILNGDPYKSENLSGPVNFKWYGDWYSETARLIYEPQNGTKGKLKLYYKFHTLF